jgi:hypothetical protein
MIALTLLACGAALGFRGALRGRWWAWRISAAGSLAERGAYLGALAGLGGDARWGVAALLASARSDIRQLGVVTLGAIRDDWATARLRALLDDPDDAVRALAAQELARRGDSIAVASLVRLYTAGGDEDAAAACAALERLATRGAIAALSELSDRTVDVPRRAALVDALGGIGDPECAPALLRLLSDHRECALPSRVEKRAAEIIAELRTSGRLPFPVDAPESRPTAQSPPVATTPAPPHRPRTIAERAAAALVRITGLSPAFASDLSEEQRVAAAQQWREWCEKAAVGP